jgi:ParB family transcriptional regulator, chromosome partitioning protein
MVQADRRNYFGRISKSLIIADLKEARGSVAPGWEKAKKGDLAAIAEREIAGTSWLPSPLKRAT